MKQLKKLNENTLQCGNTTIAEVKWCYVPLNITFTTKGKSVCSVEDDFDADYGKRVAIARAKQKALKIAKVELNSYKKEHEKVLNLINEELRLVEKNIHPFDFGE